MQEKLISLAPWLLRWGGDYGSQMKTSTDSVSVKMSLEQVVSSRSWDQVSKIISVWIPTLR